MKKLHNYHSDFQTTAYLHECPLTRIFYVILTWGYPTIKNLSLSSIVPSVNNVSNISKRRSWCTLEDNIPFDSFNERMNRSKFVVCPMGFGIDTHRFYEAAWLGCTPIVITSGLDDLYKKFGALIVDSWDEVTEELLSRHEKVEVPDFLFKVEDYITHSP
jgi:hypothetical protein